MREWTKENRIKNAESDMAVKMMKINKYALDRAA